MEIVGLPLHPLAVHGAVVLAPIAALIALASVRPAWRERLRWPALVGALVAAGIVVVAYLSGDSFREANAFFNDPASATTARIDDHEQFGTILLWTTLAFGMVTVLRDVLRTKSLAVQHALSAVVALAAAAVLVLVVLTGHSGAQAVWAGFSG